ncbi:MAG: hypothetical protein JXB49_25800, partial [Bacteroidales bacterium]|nr:hypothetical protein [Bacteroidales bacterium]
AFQARIVSLAPGYDRNAQSPTTFYCDTVMGKARNFDDTIVLISKKFLFADPQKEKKTWKNPAHKSKSLAARPCNHRFAAKHMLFLPTHRMI